MAYFPPNPIRNANVSFGMSEVVFRMPYSWWVLIPPDLAFNEKEKTAWFGLSAVSRPGKYCFSLFSEKNRA
jgi:hypothetical protein